MRTSGEISALLRRDLRRGGERPALDARGVAERVHVWHDAAVGVEEAQAAVDERAAGLVLAGAERAHERYWLDAGRPHKQAIFKLGKRTVSKG